VCGAVVGQIAVVPQGSRSKQQSGNKSSSYKKKEQELSPLGQC